MTEKRYKVHNMIKGMNIGESVDLETMKELIKKYGTYENVEIEIMDNGKSMTYKEVVDLLNENEQLKEELEEYNADAMNFETLYNQQKEINKQLKEDKKITEKRFELDDEVTINNELKEMIKELESENAKRDITYSHGKFRLEEWGKRYHQFYNGDEPLEDKEVVSLLFENEQLKGEKYFLASRNQKLNINNELYDAENEQLRIKNKGLQSELRILKKDVEYSNSIINHLTDENEQLKEEYNKLKHRHSLLHDVCIEAECDRDGYHKDVLSLEKENEYLKSQLKKFKLLGVVENTLIYSVTK